MTGLGARLGWMVAASMLPAVHALETPSQRVIDDAERRGYRAGIEAALGESPDVALAAAEARGAREGYAAGFEIGQVTGYAQGFTRATDLAVETVGWACGGKR